ncbi:hypothetical protein BU197_01165 [Streptomyces sp. CBMA291]|nr:hypothetical protein [Streptomyces sp. CBMA291]MBD0714332.1 hypothetical protein [Streptomyces sp. CBMA370]
MKSVTSAKRPEGGAVRSAGRSSASGGEFAGASMPRHPARGALGFGLPVDSAALPPVIGPIALLAAPPTLIVSRGRPSRRVVGPARTVSRGRLGRRCEDGVRVLTGAPGNETDPEPRRAPRVTAEKCVYVKALPCHHD